MSGSKEYPKPVQWTESISRFFLRVASYLCLALVLLTFEQVISRYFFGSSSVALQELEWHLFGFLFLLAMAHTLRKDAHVRVDFLSAKLSSKNRAIIDTIGILLFLIPTCLIFIYYGSLYAFKAYSYTSSIAPDAWSKSLFTESDLLYQLASLVEGLLRSTMLVGEVSPDSGGLEARWIIKAAVPLGFFVLLLQSFAELIKRVYQILGWTSDGS